MIELLGWLGAALLAICGLPQLIKSSKSTITIKGVSLLFLLIWILGEIFTLIYVFIKAFRWPLIFNYLFNILIISGLLLIYFLYKDKEDHDLIKELFYKICSSRWFLWTFPFLISENLYFLGIAVYNLFFV